MESLCSYYFTCGHSSLAAKTHTYEAGRRKDKRGVDLISDVLPFGPLWQAERRRECKRIRGALQPSHDAVIRVYDAPGNVIETHDNKGDFKQWW